MKGRTSFEILGLALSAANAAPAIPASLAMFDGSKEMPPSPPPMPPTMPPPPFSSADVSTLMALAALSLTLPAILRVVVRVEVVVVVITVPESSP